MSMGTECIIDRFPPIKEARTILLHLSCICNLVAAPRIPACLNGCVFRSLSEIKSSGVRPKRLIMKHKQTSSVHYQTMSTPHFDGVLVLESPHIRVHESQYPSTLLLLYVPARTQEYIPNILSLQNSI